MPWLVGLTLLNAAISAAYYLKIVATLFVRPLPAHAIADEAAEPIKTVRSAPLSLGVGISVATVLGLGLIWPLTDALTRRLGAAGTTITQPAGPKPQQTASASE
jgi:NADH:ubiquinone oxidoreductase subunit 2 (subunit N)